jgi:enhancer of polycomb-like protein
MRLTTTYIPTPDSTGVIEGYEEWSPKKRIDLAIYIRSLETADEAFEFCFTYFMDQDHRWENQIDVSFSLF